MSDFAWPNESLDLKWSGDAVPRVGDTCRVYINNLGAGEVVGYFVEHGYLGVKVKLWYPPEWYVNQNTTDGICHVFGNELKPRKPKAEAA